MRPLFRLGILVAIAAVTALSPTIDRATAASIVVTDPGGGSHVVELDQLAGKEDTFDREYTVVDTAGARSSERVTGFSIGVVIAAAGLAPDSFQSAEVTGPSGQQALLTVNQVHDGSQFKDGSPVFYATGGGVRFVRPFAGEGDANAEECMTASGDSAIELRLSDKPLIELKVNASTLAPKPRQRVRFEAVATGAAAGESLDFEWYFDDGKGAVGRSSSHSFAKPGRYRVMVRAMRERDTIGVAAAVLVRVGKSRSSSKRTGGGTNDTAKAPDHGSGTARSGRTPSQAKQAPTRSEPKRRRQPSLSDRTERVDGRSLNIASLPATTPPKLVANPALAARTGSVDEPARPLRLADAARMAIAIGLVLAGVAAHARTVRRGTL